MVAKEVPLGTATLIDLRRPKIFDRVGLLASQKRQEVEFGRYVIDPFASKTSGLESVSPVESGNVGHHIGPSKDIAGAVGTLVNGAVLVFDMGEHSTVSGAKFLDIEVARLEHFGDEIIELGRRR